MRSITLSSPAKLNLYLKVLNKRPDGYHNIVTLFERIDLCDEITFTLNQDGKIRIQCNHPQVPVGPKNLVYRAARLLQDNFKVKEGVNIKIRKRIPVAAGLAGGSSNAATALLGLNQLWGLHLSRQQLLKYAAEIGSDVSFFLHGCPWALGSQRGEKITRISLKKKLWHVIVVPKVKLYASEVYGALKLRLTKPNDDVNILIHNLKKNDLTTVGHLLWNDLEAPVVKLFPAILKLKEKLKSLNTQGVMVSGSGPAVFVLTQSRQEAQQIQSVLAKRYSQVFVAGTLWGKESGHGDYGNSGIPEGRTRQKIKGVYDGHFR